jgi:Ser-tRNA(Ala) deacylase AlaX
MEFFITLLFFFCSFICQLLLEIDVKIIYRLVNYGVLLLLVVVSLMVKSTTGVPMSRVNVDIKPQRRRLITQQHTQQPVTSPPIPRSIIHN